MNISNVNQVASVSTNSNLNVKSKNDNLDVNDFLKLIAAQLQNQDAMKPMEDTAFIAQMAQFTSLEAMESMNQTSFMSYTTSMLGKEVVVNLGLSGDKELLTSGVVEGVILDKNSPKVIVNGEQYDINDIVEVHN